MELWALNQHSVTAMCIRLTALLGVLYTVLSQVHFEGDDPFVWTKLGGLRGVYQNFSGKAVAAFLGVPFAQPPVGNLRFEKPHPVQNWWNGYCPPKNSRLARSDCNSLENYVNEDQTVSDIPTCTDCVRDAKKPANSCMLTPDNYFPGFRGSEMWNPPNVSEISEDCLYLNMWVPQDTSGEVLVWIFGGGFFSGSPSLDLYNGKVFAARHSVIVVNINYRLGPFGFLYLGKDHRVTGNMGLLDQQIALKWISDNIREFGGDPTKVTLFGESAGSASVTAHLLAEGSHNYFSKVICLSASLTNLWATRSPDTVKKVSLELSSYLNCTKNEDGKSILECLKEKEAGAIQSAGDDAFNHELPMTFPFAPINEDDVFFKGKVFDHLENRNFKKGVSAIFGTVDDEGTFWLPYYLSEYGFAFNSTLPAESEENKALINDEQYQNSMGAFMPYFDGSEESKNMLINGYKTLFTSPTPEENLRDGVGRFLGDLFFTCNISSFVDIFAEEQSNSVYMYYFDIRSSANTWPKWMGVMHGYEIEYMFGQPLSNPTLYEEDLRKTEKKLSKYIMKMWAKFVKTGKPSDMWDKYTSSNRKGLVLDKDLKETPMYVDLLDQQCELIKNAIPAPGQPMSSTTETDQLD